MTDTDQTNLNAKQDATATLAREIAATVPADQLAPLVVQLAALLPRDALHTWPLICVPSGATHGVYSMRDCDDYLFSVISDAGTDGLEAKDLTPVLQWLRLGKADALERQQEKRGVVVVKQKRRNRWHDVYFANHNAPRET